MTTRNVLRLQERPLLRMLAMTRRSHANTKDLLLISNRVMQPLLILTLIPLWVGVIIHFVAQGQANSIEARLRASIITVPQTDALDAVNKGIGVAVAQTSTTHQQNLTPSQPLGVNERNLRGEIILLFVSFSRFCIIFFCKLSI